MTRTKLSLALVSALLGLALSSSAQAQTYQLQVFNKGIRAAAVSEAPVTPTKPATHPPLAASPARFTLSGNPAAQQDFGAVTVGERAAQATALTVVNEGGMAGSLPVPAFIGANAGDFTSTSDCNNVAAGASCEVLVDFQPTVAGYRYAVLPVANAEFTFSGTGLVVATRYHMLSAGESYRIPSGVTSITAWVVGGGGGGSGSISSTSGGGGAAAALMTHTFDVVPGHDLTYRIGASGSGGVGAVAGTQGGTTTLNYGTVSLTAYGGSGGYYNTRASSAGGTCAGTGTCITGGTGGGSSGKQSGAGGGALGAGEGRYGNSTNGAPGTSAILPSELQAALASLGIPLGKGASGYSGTGPSGASNGASATGFGNGAGGPGISGGNGGNGTWGGGGSGASGGGTRTGGAGGPGTIVLKLN